MYLRLSQCILVYLVNFEWGLQNIEYKKVGLFALIRSAFEQQLQRSKQNSDKRENFPKLPKFLHLNHIIQFRQFLGGFLSHVNSDSFVVCCVVTMVQICVFWKQTRKLLGSLNFQKAKKTQAAVKNSFVKSWMFFLYIYKEYIKITLMPLIV